MLHIYDTMIGQGKTKNKTWD